MVIRKSQQRAEGIGNDSLGSQSHSKNRRRRPGISSWPPGVAEDGGEDVHAELLFQVVADEEEEAVGDGGGDQGEGPAAAVAPVQVHTVPLHELEQDEERSRSRRRTEMHL